MSPEVYKALLEAELMAGDLNKKAAGERRRRRQAIDLVEQRVGDGDEERRDVRHPVPVLRGRGAERH